MGRKGELEMLNFKFWIARGPRKGRRDFRGERRRVTTD